SSKQIRILGDGARTALRWAGRTHGPIFRLKGPSQASLEDLSLFGQFNEVLADGVVIEQCDQSGGTIHADQVNVKQAREIGLWIDGLEQTSTILDAFYHEENQQSVLVSGTGSYSAQTVIHGGGAANNLLSYVVRDQGDLLVQDVWYETGSTNRQFLVLTNE